VKNLPSFAMVMQIASRAGCASAWGFNTQRISNPPAKHRPLPQTLGS
jgi:hypothetical protein